jgi:transposase-like protein
MSLHRRVRGRYASSTPNTVDVRTYLSPDDEAEALGVLREQFLHEQRITSDDIRFVVRAIASHGGKKSLPPDFPPTRWIMNFKRAQGFVALNNCAYPPYNDVESECNNSSPFGKYAVPVHSENQEQERDPDQDHSSDGDRETDFGSTASSGSYETADSEKRTYKLSHTVPPETWEKAIAAVEKQGMSLRSAARAYGVHFAALHRRVKKRAQGDRSGNGLDGYLHTDDEAGIIRVVVARAELGVLMSFDELMDLVQRTALRNLPNISIDAAKKLMNRFESRNEHAIRHIISDWPLPRIHSIYNSNPSSSYESLPPRIPRTQFPPIDRFGGS